MRVGDLRDRVGLSRATTVADGQGGQGRTFTAYAQGEPASVMPLSAPVSREGAAAGQLKAQYGALVTLRARTDVSVADRVTFGTRTLEIQAVQDPDGRRHWLQLVCVEVLA